MQPITKTSKLDQSAVSNSEIREPVPAPPKQRSLAQIVAAMELASQRASRTPESAPSGRGQSFSTQPSSTQSVVPVASLTRSQTEKHSPQSGPRASSSWVPKPPMKESCPPETISPSVVTTDAGSSHSDFSQQERSPSRSMTLATTGTIWQSSPCRSPVDSMGHSLPPRKESSSEHKEGLQRVRHSSSALCTNRANGSESTLPQFSHSTPTTPGHSCSTQSATSSGRLNSNRSSSMQNVSQPSPNSATVSCSTTPSPRGVQSAEPSPNSARFSLPSPEKSPTQRPSPHSSPSQVSQVGRAAIPKLMQVQFPNNMDIRFSQEGVSCCIRGDKTTVKISDLKKIFAKEGFSPSAPPLQVVKMPDGQYTSYDNRRLYALHWASQEELGVHGTVPMLIYNWTDQCYDRVYDYATCQSIAHRAGSEGLDPQVVAILQESDVQLWGHVILGRTMGIGNGNSKAPCYGFTNFPHVKPLVTPNFADNEWHKKHANKMIKKFG